MYAAGTGRRLPTDQHAQYQSGHCQSGFHDRCLGAYAGVSCRCLHHTTPPPEPVPTVTVRCVFGCQAIVGSIDPWAAHEGMEAHYRADHADDIARAVAS